MIYEIDSAYKATVAWSGACERVCLAVGAAVITLTPRQAAKLVADLGEYLAAMVDQEVE